MAIMLVDTMLCVCFLGNLVESTAPNIVVIVADDLGWNDVGYHGSEIKTPNIDSLAASGVKLQNYYVQPICSPSRSQLLSGRYQIHTGLQHSVIWHTTPSCLPTDIPTLADKLKEMHYSTHIVGKWHLGFYKKKCTPTYRGFDSFFGYLGGAEDYFDHSRGGYDFHDIRYGEEIDSEKYKGQYSTHLFTHRAQELAIKHVEMKEKKPLFTYLSYQAVHEPLQVPQAYIEQLKNEHYVDDRRMKFAAMVHAMDEGIGNLTRTYKEHGLWDNTVLLFTTDNGGSPSSGGNNWPWRGKKNTLWEGGIHGVGFVSGGLVEDKAGTENTQLIHISDWFPTLVHLAGGRTEGLNLDGYDVWDAIKGKVDSPRKELLHNIDPLATPVGQQYPNSTFDTRIRAAIRAGNYKLITGKAGLADWIPIDQSKTIASPDDENKNVWLFNIKEDPEETTDLSTVKPDVVEELLERLHYYNTTAVLCNYPARDPKGKPGDGGYWGPWIHTD